MSARTRTAAGTAPRHRTKRTPATAFDALYVRTATPLLRQLELLTGDPAFAQRAVVRAFDLAWQRWPEVARDSDPVGWVRAAAYEYALAPWRRRVPGHGPHPRTPGGAERVDGAKGVGGVGGAKGVGGAGGAKDPGGSDSALEAALLGLPPARRRAVLLHDGLGLGLRAAAAEVEATTVTAAGRITLAREALTAAVPDLDDAAVRTRLRALLGTGLDREPPRGPGDVREASERGARRRTVGAFAVAGLIAVAATAAVLIGPGAGSGSGGGSVPGPGHHNGVGPPPSGARSHAVKR